MKGPRITLPRRPRLALFAGLAWLFGLAAVFAIETRPAPNHLALVIGNADYAIAPLPTAANDAALIATTLATQGFDVIAAADADGATLRNVIEAFRLRLATAGPEATIVVYVSGYGLQANGGNFLVPIDAKIDRDVDIAPNAFPLSLIAEAVGNAPARIKVVVYDVSRDAPFARHGAPLASGLTLVEAPERTVYAFNMAPGAVAPVDIGLHGIYATTLAALLETPDISLATLFRQLRLRVTQATDGAVIPWADVHLSTDSLLASDRTEGPAAATPDPAIAGLSDDVAIFVALARDALDAYDGYLAVFPNSAQSPRIRAMTAARREALIWAASVKADVAVAFWTYLRRYSRGPHVFDARRRLADLKAALEPPPRFDLWNYRAFGDPAPDDAAVLARHPLRFDDPDWSPLPPPPKGVLLSLHADDADLVLPPLAVPHALPLFVPSRLGRGAGSIEQPFVTKVGRLETRFESEPDGAVVMQTIGPDGLVSRSESVRESARRIVTQRDLKGAVISRTITTTGSGGAATVQTGPNGGILAKVTVQTAVDGARDLVLTNGRNQMIAEVKRDKAGVLVEAAFGPGAGRGQTNVVEPSQNASAPPTVAPVDKVEPKPVSPRQVATTPSTVSGHPTIPAPPRDLKVEAPPLPPPPQPPRPLKELSKVSPRPAAAAPSAPIAPTPKMESPSPKPMPPTPVPTAASSGKAPAVAPLPPTRPTKLKFATPVRPAATRRGAPHARTQPTRPHRAVRRKR